MFKYLKKKFFKNITLIRWHLTKNSKFSHKKEKRKPLNMDL